MNIGRTLVLAVDGLDEHDVSSLRRSAALRSLEHGQTPGPDRPPDHPDLGAAAELRILPGGPSEPAPALVSLATGASVAGTGVATDAPFSPPLTGTAAPAAPTWHGGSLTVPTLFEQVGAQDLVTAALQWPATAGARIDLCLPLVEDLRRYRNRWDMAEATSSPRMVAEHLAPRRAAGVQLSQVPPDALVAEIAAESCQAGRIDLLAVRLTGLGEVRRREGLDSAAATRALADTADALGQILEAHLAGPADRVLLLPGRPLVPTTLLVHPNTALAASGLVSTDGPQLGGFRALVWPDGPRGVLHVRREEPAAVRDAAIAALEEIAALEPGSRLRLRRVQDGVGASAQTDVIAVLEGMPGTVFGLSATHRPLVDGGDPYYAGPRAVTDPSAPTTALGWGPGLSGAAREGSWADLGVTLAGALGVELPGATAQGMHAESTVPEAPPG